MFVFPDTNIFLHFRSLNEIDLPKILELEEVVLCFAPIIISELDDLKWVHRNQGIRDRAKSSVRKVKQWLNQQTPVRQGVTAALAPRPSEETFTMYHLNKQSSDDIFLASNLEQRKLQEPEEVICLTADIGPQIKAEALGIRILELKSEYRLPHAQDALTKENIRLKEKLADLEGRMPSIEFLFDNRTKQLGVELEAQMPDLTNDMLRELSKAVNELKPVEHYLRDSEGLKSQGFLSVQQILASVGMVPPEEEIERYKNEFKKYKELYRGYLQSRLEVENQHRRIIQLNFLFVNSGTAPAEDIFLELFLPNKLKWYKEPSRSNFPQAPDPPRPPRSVEEIQRLSLNPPWRDHQMDLPPGFHDTGAWIRDNSSRRVPSIDGQQLSWELGDCRHTQFSRLDPLYVMYRSSDDISNFDIEYKIVEKNTSESIRGKVLIRIT